MRDDFVGRLSQLADANSRIMLVTADLGFGVLTEYAQRFPRQFINAGVAEQNMTSLATGLALEGYIVFTYSIANFAFMRCLEQIRNDATYHQANVNVVAIGGGFSYGQLGVSHFATEDLSMMWFHSRSQTVCPGHAGKRPRLPKPSPSSCTSYILLHRYRPLKNQLTRRNHLEVQPCDLAPRRLTDRRRHVKRCPRSRRATRQFHRRHSMPGHQHAHFVAV